MRSNDSARPAPWYVARLTVPVWLIAIWPRLAWRRLRGRRVERCAAVEHSPAGLGVAQAMGRWLGVRVEPLAFRLLDIRDEQGVLVRLRLAYGDLADVQAQVLREPQAREALGASGLPTGWPGYMAKALATIDFAQPDTLWHAMLLMQVCRWDAARRATGRARPRCVVLIERLPWRAVLERYASTQGVALAAIPRLTTPAQWLRDRLRPLYRWLRLAQGAWRWPSPPAGSLPTLATDSFGPLNLDRPELHSDVFFWQQSGLPARHLLMLFHAAGDPLDDEKLAQLRERGMDGAAITLAAARAASRPAFRPRLAAARGKLRLPRGGGADGAWLRARAADYQMSRQVWERLFAAHDVKVYLTWYRYPPVHCAIGDALESLGGLLAIYQRAYEGCPSAYTAVTSDLFFGYSRAGAEVERRSGSRVRSYVVTGYLGDHRAPLLRDAARRLRERMQARGAQRIMAFLDEGALNHRWWFLDEQAQQASHQALLERVLTEPWFGLILKPKKHTTLRAGLGPVAELLRRAEATGRCYVFEDGAHPPAAAALAADVAVHGHLFTGTAGLESALAGVPTLLLDREGWPWSPLNRLGSGVVFHDWPALWQACLEQWRSAEGVPGFGDWSEMLEELDPFRDGRAACRMGTYVQWLVEGFAAGLRRDAVLAQASERYAARWGREMILTLDGSPAASGRPVAEPVLQPAEAPSA